MAHAPRPATTVGRAWLLLTFALLLHVADEALNGFLSIYNPTVIALRERVPWLPAPTFRSGPWLAGLLTGIAALLFTSRFVYRGARWTRPVAYVLAGIMLFNGAGHVAATIAGRTVATVPVEGAGPAFTRRRCCLPRRFTCWPRWRRRLRRRRSPRTPRLRR